MTHEFKDIVHQAIINQQIGLKNVLATVVFLKGSSYRKPGVRMLIAENGTMIGAVSGGCVENEIKRRAQSVFNDHNAKIITYDGRHRLGCEGMLYILIEPFEVSKKFHTCFKNCLDNRQVLHLQSYYRAVDESQDNFGTFITLGDKNFTFSKNFKISNVNNDEVFSQVLQPCFRLLIIGGEHDSVKLCTMAGLLGWEVEVVTSIKDPKQCKDFPGAKLVTAQTPETIDLTIDAETAVVLMTHNYAQDLKYLLKLQPLNPKYIGVLGSTKRRERLESELFNYTPNVTEIFLDTIYSPAGLHIGAITPEEIALSILSEILSVVRCTEVVSLKSIKGKIHC